MKYWFLSAVLLLPLAVRAADPDESKFKSELRKRNVVISDRQMASIWDYVRTPEGENPLKGRALYQQLCDYKAYHDQKLMSYCHIALQESFRAQYPLAFLADYRPQAEIRRYELDGGLAYVLDITGKVKDRAKHVPAVLRVRLEQESGNRRDFVLLWFDGYWAFVL